jgi:hypothetical protein
MLKIAEMAAQIRGSDRDPSVTIEEESGAKTVAKAVPTPKTMNSLIESRYRGTDSIWRTRMKRKLAVSVSATRVQRATKRTLMSVAILELARITYINNSRKIVKEPTRFESRIQRGIVVRRGAWM